VLVGTAAATTMRSPFQRSAMPSAPSLELPTIGVVDEVQSDSRQVTIKPGQPIVVKMTGQGCAALVAFLKP
jgi:hydroxyethylthiazole kinase-like sugar kinase family protein